MTARHASGSQLKLFRRFGAVAVSLVVFATLSNDPGPEPTAVTAAHTLEQIKDAGVLSVVTRRGYTTWFSDSGRSVGFEHDLVAGLARHLGVTPHFAVANTPGELLNRLTEGEFHIGAGSIAAAASTQEGLKVSESFVDRRYQLVRHRSTPNVANLGELAGRKIVVPSGSSAVGFLQQLTVNNPLLKWSVSTTADTEELLRAVDEGRLEFTIADTNTITAMQQHLPSLVVEYDFQDTVSVAWAFHPATDPALLAEVAVYLDQVRRHGELSRLEERYFEPARHKNNHDLRVFRDRVADTLPQFRHLFIEAGNRHNVDWRLMAALSYQESLWNPKAVSGTGVRGIMQLTKATAKTLSADRENVPEAITAATRYISMLTSRFPDTIDNTDRKWMALAAYNVGPGHLDDARELTKLQGGNADVWRDVKRTLPLLRDPDYHQFTRFGRARGDEAVHLVTRVRSFYDVLVRLEAQASDYQATPINRAPTTRTTVL